ncbi:MAG: phosphate acyltransferase PlsX [Lachnospiraceae bacterium]|nr:phosphate acyltransferase PlsX [Lachnospiraceae bacterium]
MSDITKVALDAMGGDNAPVEVIKGAVDAVNLNDNIVVYVTGTKEAVDNELSKYSYPSDRIIPVYSTEIIETAEPPVMAIRQKKDSSIVRGLNLVKEGTADAFVSAGSSGAVLVGGQLLIGRIKGVERPPLAPLIPTSNGVSLLVDCGANVDARPNHLVQFAKMGSVYMEHVIGVKNPTVGILNIGAEEDKGNALVKETFPMLKNTPGINFTGSVEARDVINGNVDVIVCEAFAGNVCLKMMEGVAKTLMKEIKGAMLSSVTGKLGAALVAPNLKKALKKYDASEYGGAPLLGLKGLVVKTHGNSKAREIMNSILQCVSFKEGRIADRIREQLEK